MDCNNINSNYSGFGIHYNILCFNWWEESWLLVSENTSRCFISTLKLIIDIWDMFWSSLLNGHHDQSIWGFCLSCWCNKSLNIDYLCVWLQYEHIFTYNRTMFLGIRNYSYDFINNWIRFLIIVFNSRDSEYGQKAGG